MLKFGTEYSREQIIKTAGYARRSQKLSNFDGSDASVIYVLQFRCTRPERLRGHRCSREFLSGTDHQNRGKCMAKLKLFNLDASGAWLIYVLQFRCERPESIRGHHCSREFLSRADHQNCGKCISKLKIVQI